MKVLLTTLNAKYIHSNLALRYLYAAASDVPADLFLEEYTINNEEDSVYIEILSGEYDVICFSCYIWNIEQILSLAENIAKARPDTTILLGGPEVSHRAVELMAAQKAVDLILAGEGEESFPLLLRELSLGQHANLNRVPGLTHRERGRIVSNPKGLFVPAEKIPFPYAKKSAESAETTDSINEILTERNRILYYESSRGCPYACTYCLSSVERGVRPLPLNRVKEELEFLLSLRVKQVKFVDRTFNWDRSRTYELFRFLMDKDNGVTNFHMELCGELLDEETLDLLSTARTGLFQFEIGIQTTNPTTLAAINRTSDFAKLSANLRRILIQNNIHIHLDLIAGLPYEDYETFRNSFNQVYELSPHHLQMGFLKLLPGTPIVEQIPEHGYIYRDKPPYELISNRYLPADRLVSLKKIETVLDLYYNRGGFRSGLEFAAGRQAMTAFDFYEDFAYFYYAEGFQKKSHTKENLYRILHRYGSRKEQSLPGIGKELEDHILADIRYYHDPEAAKRIIKEGWDY